MATTTTTSQNSSLVFRIDDRLLQHRPPRLTLAATLTALCQRVKCRELDANFVVDILTENRLLPYMIGHNYKIFDVSLGRKTNASKVGDLIVSQECIRGTYELCIAFLDFVLATLCDPNYKDTTKTMLASVTYVLNEIYTSHHIWTYKKISDMERISCLCTEIFHQIIANAKEPTGGEKYSELEIVSIISLSQNQAHKELLDVIVDGKSNIRKKMEELNLTTEQSLCEVPAVICVRQSLFIFNKLLTHSKFLKDFCDIETLGQSSYSPSHYQHGASSSTAPMTSIERALFDTSIRPGLLQHLFSYIYQKADSSTACLAVGLVKNIAKKFSMSLMACLGSEADKVCDFFVECLSNKEAKIDLEVAILDLLSTCVKHQPGLIELFLNYKRETKSDTDQKEQSSTKLISLEVVMNLLKECKVRQEDAYKLLHTYIMKFILTFWQKNHSAIEQFDKAAEFWDYVTHPLIKFLDAETKSTGIASTNYSQLQALNDKLNSYALMILAREVFCLNAGISERKMNSNLSNILNEMSQKDLLGKYSSYIRKKYSNVSSNLDKSSDYNHMLAAWRDFLTSYVKYKPFETAPEVQAKIIGDILECLIIELRLGEKLDKERIASSGDTLLLVWSKWMPKNSSGDSVFQSIHQLIYLADSLKEYLPFSFLLTFQSTLNLYLARNRDYLIESKRSFDLFVPALQLMQFSLKITEKYLSEQSRSIEFNYKPGVESRLCLASIMTLRFIIDVSRNDVEFWIAYVQTNLKTDSLVQFLGLLMTKRAGSEICLAVIELLLCLSSIPQAANYLNKAALMNQVNKIVVSAYERPYAHLSQLASTLISNNARVDKPQSNPKEVVGAGTAMSDTVKIYLDTMNSDHKWLPIYWMVLRLNISMMFTLNKDYMSTAVEFLSIHCIRICELLELLRTKPRSVNMEEILQMLYMISLVLQHARMWKKRNNESYQAISDEFAKTAYTLATSALPPPTTSQPVDQQRTSIKPKDCLVYARCCYDFGKYTEAERVLFQTKFGDKNGFIKEAAQIYGDELGRSAFHLAALICVKTNRQQDSIDFALQVFADDSEIQFIKKLTKRKKK